MPPVRGPRYDRRVPLRVEIRGDRSLEFPELDHADEITHARIVCCRFERWDEISRLQHLTSLEVIEWLGPSFDALRPLGELEQLHIHHMPHVTNLNALGDLQSLRRLILETRPSWDGSRVTQVDSLEPLRSLALEEINMFGVRPASKAVDDLLAIPTLKTARLSKFAVPQIKRINAMIANERVDWREPSWAIIDEATARTGSRSERVIIWSRQAQEDETP
jgi:hypothetical protein